MVEQQSVIRGSSSNNKGYGYSNNNYGNHSYYDDSRWWFNTFCMINFCGFIYSGTTTYIVSFLDI